MSLWTQQSGTTLITLQERITTSVPLPISESSATITLLSGDLPRGMRIEGTNIVGTPYEVPRETTYRFVLRANFEGTINDRTYNIVVQGEDEPVWLTNEDLLPIGNNNAYYILDSAPVEFQLEVTDTDTAAGEELEFFIGTGDGELPPGIQLTTDGRLVGVVDPILALEKTAGAGYFDQNNYGSYPYDFGLKPTNGFDSYFYDTTIYDYSTPSQSPKKLNRYYQFTVSVSDGDTVSRRTFRIYVVGDDFLRADNTIMQVGTGTFTADNTYIRTPIWLTPRNLGYRRANNYVTLFLETIDPNSLTGVVNYILQDTNDDDSPSVLPPGLELDPVNGSIGGVVPYQPEVTREYKFTVRATRTTGAEGEEAYSDKTFIVNLLGEVDSEITWLTDSDLGDVSSNYISTLSVKAETTVTNARLLYSLVDGRLPPGLSLSFDGEIIGKINSFGSESAEGLTVFDSASMQFDGNTTTIDRDYTFTVEVKDQFQFSAAQRTFTVSVSDPDDKLYSNLYMRPFLKQEQRSAFFELVSNPEIFDPNYIYRPNDVNFGVQKEIKILAYAGIETKLIQEYVAATAKYHKRKQYKLGSVKTAVAKTPGTNDIVYEVVYVEVIDPYKPTSGKVRKTFNINTRNTITVDGVQYSTKDDNSGLDALDPMRNRPNNPNTIKVDSDAILISQSKDYVRYISNIDNMRDSLKELGETERNFLPLWMRTAQEDSIQELGYVPAIPLCYTTPGNSKIVANAIENAEFDFSQFNIDIDRYVIDSTTGVSEEQYIVFANYQFNI
jgi:hypothetical protein